MTQVVASEFAELYRAHFGRIAGQLSAYLGDHTEAQDLTQEAFCRALDRWSTVSRFADAPAWVRTVAWNLATSRLRHLQVRARHLARQREEHVDGPQPDRVAITRALAALPPNQRVAVILYHLGDLSTVEIAEQQGVPEGTVRSWLTRGRARLAELLAEGPWDQLEPREASPPPPAGGLDAARRTVGRRKATRGVIAAVIALAIAVTTAVVLHGRVVSPPVIGPTGPPTGSPAVESRRIDLPGVGSNTPPVLAFVDRSHGWVLFDTCYVVQSGCRRVMGKTSDGGRTWRPVPVPPITDAPDGAVVVMDVLDADTTTLAVLPRTSDVPLYYLLTTDGGKTFVRHPATAPPLEAQLAMRTKHCRGTTGSTGTGCDNLTLVRAGLTPAALPQGWPAEHSYASKGADGRIWLTRGRTDATDMMVSADGGRSWKSLPWPEFGVRLHLSPDGRDVWVTSQHRFYELTGDQWTLRHTLPQQDSTGALAYLGGGEWFGRLEAGFGYLRDWQFTPSPPLPDAFEPIVLPDGAVVVRTQAGTYLGADGAWAYVAR